MDKNVLIGKGNWTQFWKLFFIIVTFFVCELPEWQTLFEDLLFDYDPDTSNFIISTVDFSC